MKNLLTFLGSIFVVWNNFWGEIILTGIFGTGAVLQTDINLILQIVMVLIIIIGLVYKNKNKFKIHGGIMGIAVILGIVLVGAWALRPSNIAACSRMKRLMDITVLLWLISLIFGIATYMVFYV
jgi:uncharacterized membrane protein YozB (DUF420 family)